LWFIVKRTSIASGSNRRHSRRQSSDNAAGARLALMDPIPLNDIMPPLKH
jgi:hypothetical protein